LRDFHRAHFPGQKTPPLRETSTVLPDSATPEAHEDDEDDLGWYHDGVKRTLTDEQVAMFRHSEIQRLLQQRRLNANQAVRHSDIQANEESGLSKQRKRAKRNKRANESVALQSEDAKLDYGQEKEKSASAPGQVDRQQHHRKVVKYSDGLDEPDQWGATKEIDRSSGRIGVSQTFHWPKLGP
jgi:hypothetical protein